MDALIERQTANLLLAAKQIAEDQHIPVKERIVRTILALHMDTEQPDGQKMMEQIHKPQNTLMHQKTKKILLQGIPSIMADIVRDGTLQGIFKTLYPLECMEMALCYLDVMLDDDVFDLTED